MKIGVAISTTGDEHRLGFLETSVRKWCELDDVSSLYVTVDGDEEALDRAVSTVHEHTGRFTDAVYRVGQGGPVQAREGRLGVAANKNTGLELLMDQTDCEHLFLCDDDTWPRNEGAVQLHTEYAEPHSMVCWGRHRFVQGQWTWPRGCVLYATRSVVETVGGMIEAFGPGGHEHVEWSRRIHQAGLTSVVFPAPLAYSTYGGVGAAAHWHAEDMAKRGEPLGNHRLRRRNITSVRRLEGDWDHIEGIMLNRDGDISYVPYRATENGRATATLTPASA